MESSSEQQLWDRTLAHLRSAIDEESFTTWLQPTKLLALHGDTVTVGVPSSFYKNWLLANYREQILLSLREVSAHELNLVFDVTPGVDQETAFITDSQIPTETAKDSGIKAGFQPSDFTKSSYLNPKYNFDSFVVGESNRFAHAACRQVADPASKSYNPLFIYGGVGLGKTHLMHAIGHHMMGISPGVRVLYVTSEQFMNSFIEAISQGKQFEFRDSYRNVDLLLIDDIQFFSGKQQTQTEFFHTFNALYDAGKKIVVSSDKPPKELTTLEDRLRSRFSWGLVVDIQAPDLETRIAILKKKAYTDGIDLPNEVTGYIAEHVKSNIRELEGVLIRLRAYAVLHKQAVTLQLARDVLGHLLDSVTSQDISADEVIESVCSYFEIRRSDLTGTSRLKRFASPRHIAQYLTRKLTGLSYPEIAQKFGGRDHTSVLHAVRKIENEMASDENVSRLLAHLTRQIRGARPAAD